MTTTLMCLDLEGTIIKTELNPEIIDNNKQVISELKEQYQIEDFFIFSSVICTINDADKFQGSVLHEKLNENFSITISNAFPIDYAWEALAGTKLKYDIMNKPCKESLFLAYIDKYFESKIKEKTRYILIDDTVNTKTIILESGNEVMFIRGK